MRLFRLFTTSVAVAVAAVGLTTAHATILPALNDPIGIAYRGTTLLVANAGTGNVLTLDGSFAPASVLAGGIVPGGFTRGTTGLAVDGDDNVYVAVADTGDVLRIPAAGGPATVYAHNLGAPIGLALAGDGTLYVADEAGKRVVAVAPDAGHTQSVAGSGFPEGPFGIAVASNGDLAVSTWKNGRIYKVSSGVVTEFVKLNIGTSKADTAEGLAYDTVGNLYVGDGKAGKLVRLSPSAVRTDLQTGLGGPIDLAFTPGTSTLVVATEGEGRTGGDAILTFDVGPTGLALASPTGLPSATVATDPAWSFRGVIATTASKPTAGPTRSVAPSGPVAVGAARYTGDMQTEATLGIQSDGDIFMSDSADPCMGGDLGVAVCGRGKVYRSKDTGSSWANKSPTLGVVETPPVSGDPYVYVDPDTNRIFDVDLTVACTWISWSDDDAETWTQNPIGCGAPPIDHQTIVAAKPTAGLSTLLYPNVLVMCSNPLAQVATECQRSLDGGLNWTFSGFAYSTVSGTATTDPSCGAGITSHLWADKEGRIFLPRSNGAKACVSVSLDSGSTWHAYPVSGALPGGPDHEGRITSDTDGNLYYVWISQDRLPWFTTSADHGITWGTPKMIAPPGVTETNLPSITAGSPGRVAISFMGNAAEYGYGAKNYSKVGWNGYIVVSTDALGPDPSYQGTTVNPQTDPLKRGPCGPGRCDLVWDFLAMQVAPDGRPWATFGDACYGTCVTNRSFDTSFTYSDGVAGTLDTGPSLFGGSLTTLPGASLLAPAPAPLPNGTSIFGAGDMQALFRESGH